MSEYDIEEILSRGITFDKVSKAKNKTFRVVDLPSPEEFRLEYKDTATGRVKQRIKLLVDFDGKVEELILNWTSMKNLSNSWGKDVKTWVGKTGSLIEKRGKHDYIEAYPLENPDEE